MSLADNSGSWPSWNNVILPPRNITDWVINNIVKPVENLINEVVGNLVEDINNYNSNNQSESDVFSSNYFSNYKGTLVIKTPFDASFSFGFIGLSSQQQNAGTLKHEYGHTIQMKNEGLVDYTTNVAIPSATINLLDRQGKLPYDYYSYPWEAEANKLGGCSISQRWKPALPQDEQISYRDLIKLFF